MFPELFRIPGLGIPLATYGVLLAIGFILALWLAARLAARDGLPKQRIYDLGLYVLAAGLVGSKALMVITEWNDYGGDWRRMLSVDFFAFGRRLLWRPAGGGAGQRHPDAPVASALAEDCGCVCAGHRAWPRHRTTGLFFRRLLLGQADHFMDRRALYGKGE